MTNHIDLKLLGTHPAIRATIDRIAGTLFPGAAIPWTTDGLQCHILDTVRLDALLASERPETPEIRDPETGAVIASALSGLPEGAHLRISLHGTPSAGDHLATIATALPSPGELGGGVIRVATDSPLAAAWEGS